RRALHLPSGPSGGIFADVKRFFVAVLVVLAALVSPVHPASAEDAKLGVRARVEPGRLGVGDRGLLRVDVDIPRGWHLWSMDPGPGPQVLAMSLEPGAGLELVDGWTGTEPSRAFDRGFGRELARYEVEAVRFERPVQGLSLAGSSLLVRGQICTEGEAGRCLSQKISVPIEVELAAQALNQPVPMPMLGSLSVAQATVAAAPLPPVPAAPAVAPVSGEQELAAARERGFLSFVALAFLFGLGALATPCVFPAIPLTVSFFSKYSGESVGRSARLASVYALTMVAAFTFLGVMLSIVFGVTGVQRFAAHPVFNLVLAGVLVFFSLNLLGLFEIQAPQ